MNFVFLEQYVSFNSIQLLQNFFTPFYCSFDFVSSNINDENLDKMKEDQVPSLVSLKQNSVYIFPAILIYIYIQ